VDRFRSHQRTETTCPRVTWLLDLMGGDILPTVDEVSCDNLLMNRD